MSQGLGAVQGEAAAGLAAIASLNKTHLPEAPLADMGVALGALRPISDAFAHARLQRRILLLLLSAFALALVGDCFSMLVIAIVFVMTLMM